MPIYRVGKYRFNTAYLIMTEDLDEDPAVAMRVTVFPGDKIDLGPVEADDFGGKLDRIEGDRDAPAVGGGVLSAFDPETGCLLPRPGTKNVPGA